MKSEPRKAPKSKQTAFEVVKIAFTLNLKAEKFVIFPTLYRNTFPHGATSAFSREKV